MADTALTDLHLKQPFKRTHGPAVSPRLDSNTQAQTVLPSLPLE